MNANMPATHISTALHMFASQDHFCANGRRIFGRIVIGFLPTRSCKLPHYCSTHARIWYHLSVCLLQTRPPIRHPAVCVPSESRLFEDSRCRSSCDANIINAVSEDDDSNDGTVDMSEFFPHSPSSSADGGRHEAPASAVAGPAACGDRVR